MNRASRTIAFIIVASLLCGALSSCTKKGYEAFVVKRVIATETFADVTEATPDYDVIKRVYELGLFSGDHNKMFAPQGQMTVAEALTLMVRVNSIFTGRKLTYAPLYSTDKWYTGYVQQAERRGIIPGQKTYTRFERGIRVEDFYAFLAHTLPEEEYEPLHPDLKAAHIEENIYYAEINRLIQAGILPYTEGEEIDLRSFIARIDAAKLVLRLIDKDQRV